MEMTDAGRHIEGLRTEHRDDLQIFGTVLDEHDSAAQRIGQRRIDHDFRRRLGSSGLCDGVGRPQNGYRYYREMPWSCLFSLSGLTRTDDVID